MEAESGESRVRKWSEKEVNEKVELESGEKEEREWRESKQANLQ